MTEAFAQCGHILFTPSKDAVVQTDMGHCNVSLQDATRRNGGSHIRSETRGNEG